MDNKPELIIDEYGTKRWYLNDLLHRIDGPAVEYANGDKEWYLNDKLHRTDGPAVERSNGDKFWYLYNKLHREDGPAIEYSDGNKFWRLNGIRYTFEEWLELTPLSEKEKVKLRLQYAK